MVVESDPVLRHGEDVADHSIQSSTHELDGTIEHVLVAKWDGADGAEDSSADGQRPDICEIETTATGGTMSTESSKSEHWRRRREATFRRKETSNASQPHVTMKLEHRPTIGDGDAKVYSSSSDRLKLPPAQNFRAEKEEVAQHQEQEKDKKEDEKEVASEGEDEENANIFRKEDGDSLPLVLRGIPSPPPSPTKGSWSTSPTAGNSVAFTEPAPPVSTNLPDIIELNVELLIGRDLALNVDGDSGGILRPQDNSGPVQPIGGIAHLKLFPKDMPIHGRSTILELPVRKTSQQLTDLTRASGPTSTNRHPLVELGDSALLRVLIEIDSPNFDSASRNIGAHNGSAIQWTMSGASAAVRAGTEEADGEEVSMAKLAENSIDITGSGLLASDGATGRRGMGTRRVPGAFCSGLSNITEMWGEFTKKCVLHCVDNCDDDALVYVHDGDGGESLGSTIDTVYGNIMF